MQDLTPAEEETSTEEDPYRDAGRLNWMIDGLRPRPAHVEAASGGGGLRPRPREAASPDRLYPAKAESLGRSWPV